MAIETAQRLIEAAHRPAVFSGAGLSAESGVGTFRDARVGHWSRFSPERLASPQGFEEDPQRVVRWYNERRRAIGRAQPNPAHRALALRGWTQITQNVDDLLQRAGADHVVQLHGTITHDRCHADCGYVETVDLADPPPLRSCPRCRALMRPAVVWFGEMLPQRAWQQAEHACTSCDLLLVVGTSAVVYPAAGLIELAKEAGARIIVINTEVSGASRLADLELLGAAGELVPQVVALR